MFIYVQRFLTFSHFFLIFWHKFSVAFLTKPYNCRLSWWLFLLSFFSLSHLTFLWPEFVFFISFQFTFLITCFNYILLQLFSRLFIFFSYSANFVSSLVIQFIETIPFFTPCKRYLHIILVKYSFLSHDLA